MTSSDDKKQQKAVEDSFPASDPPSQSGITGPRVAPRRRAPHRRDDDSRPKGGPTDDRHAAETAYQWEDQKHPHDK
jgi:hypothetical protein